jgi:2-keto-4-pentenoate hydratase/2-oxohepta-3-ene-1,7-dioic acid hydratase in catechol pathway
MRIVRCSKGEDAAFHGVLEDGLVDRIDGNIFGEWRRSGDRIRLADLRLNAPLTPPNLLCLGKNYRSFPGDDNPSYPKQPLLFIKSTSSVIGPGEPIVLPEMAASEVYFEAELAVVIGKKARNVSPSSVCDFVFGYVVANDVGAKDCQSADGQWARAKSFDSFCPLGPWIETELDPANCRVASKVNCVPVQESTTSLMIFDVTTTISFLSRCMTLQPGTVLCMGSPAALAEPRPFLRDGDSVEVEVEGIGTLANPVLMSSACKV